MGSKKQQFDKQSASFRGAGRCLSFFSIAENGCPTGPTRSDERKAAVPLSHLVGYIKRVRVIVESVHREIRVEYSQTCSSPET